MSHVECISFGLLRVGHLKTSSPARISQLLDHNAVRLEECFTNGLDSVLVQNLIHKGHELPELIARQSWEHMMLQLELQAAMKPVHPRRTRDVHC